MVRQPGLDPPGHHALRRARPQPGRSVRPRPGPQLTDVPEELQGQERLQDPLQADVRGSYTHHTAALRPYKSPHPHRGSFLHAVFLQECSGATQRGRPHPLLCPPIDRRPRKETGLG